MPRRHVDERSAEARLVLLVGLPGTGRRTLLTQLVEQARSRGASAVVLDDRATATARVRDWLDRPEDRPDVVALDDVTLGPHDPLWADCLSLVGEPGLRLLARAVDEPAVDAVPFPPPPGTLLLRDDDLYLDPVEVSTVLEANDSSSVGGDAFLWRTLVERYRGHPAIVRRVVTLHRHDQAVRGRAHRWSLEAQLLEQVLDLPAERVGASPYLAFLRAVGDLRRLTAADARDYTQDPGADRHFDRLCASPFGTVEAEPAHGRACFVWTTAAWTALRSRGDPAGRSRALAFHTARGDEPAVLFDLLDAGRFPDADAFALPRFNLVLSQAAAETRELLMALPEAAVEGFPCLVAHRALYRTIVSGPDLEGRSQFRRALDHLPVRSVHQPLTRFHVLALRLVCGTYLGDRASCRADLARLRELLEPSDFSVTAHVDHHPAGAGYFSQDCMVLGWVALQLDEHVLCRTLGDLARRYDPGTDAAVSRDVQLSSGGNATLLGTTPDVRTSFRTLTFRAAAEDRLLDGFPECFRLLDSGAVEAAREQLRAVLALPGVSIPPAAGAGLAILLEAFVDRHGPANLQTVDRFLRETREQWLDGRPGSFVVFAATHAYTVLGAPAAARAVVAASADVEADGFVCAARGIVHDAGGRRDLAVEHLDRALGPGLLAPRFAAAVRALRLTTLADLASDDDLARRCTAYLGHAPSLGVARFGLRFVRRDVYDRLLAVGDRLPSRHADLLLELDADPRPRSMDRRRLTTTEIEVLRLVRLGLSNSAISERRVVSPNTVHTQMRGIFAKLGVRTRAEAVSVAEIIGVFAD